jgi:nicotinamidase-related amidase
MRFSLVSKLTLGLLLLASIGLFAQDSGANPPTKEQIKPALLVIDIQNSYLPLMSEDDKKIGMRIINGAIWLFHQHNLPVIRVYHSDPDFGPEPGTEPFEFPKSVIVNETDPRIVKNFPSAFIKTDLEKILKEKGCNTLFLCGLSSVGCVLATYHGAQERGYKVFMIKNGIMSHNSAYTNVIENISETVTFDTLSFMLDHLK